jgi:hypothetical protein
MHEVELNATRTRARLIGLGTWIPLPEGRQLAERNNVLEKMRPIFDFVPGDKTPPPAPKHATAASGKPRMPRGTAQQKRAPRAIRKTLCPFFCAVRIALT